MRGSRIQNYRPRYRSPFFPWVQLVGIGVYTVLIIELIALLGFVPLITTGGFIVAGVLWYILYVRPRCHRESALVYMVKNIVAPDIRRGGLEDELRAIATQRDEIVHDRFDFIVRECEILDLPGPTSAEKMFKRVAKVLADRLEMDSAVLLEKLQARESVSPTVIQPGLAIPHIILKGHHLFDIVLVRCRKGIIFDVEKPYVKTAFILVGSSDERNYHLRALMAIAQVVQEKDFIKRWLAATTPESLRDLVLLSPRLRDHEKL
jgi:mannitol/fructose-specific phosphotransferase system IIA component (Ntr-type)